MARKIDAAVAAARLADAEAFADALAELTRVDQSQLAVLLGAVTRDLLERAHPDGLDTDDAEQVMDSCIRATASWYPALDSDALIRALTGALGIIDPDGSSEHEGPAVLAHGVLLIADQLTVMDQALTAVLELALQELMRAQTVEMP